MLMPSRSLAAQILLTVGAARSSSPPAQWCAPRLTLPLRPGLPHDPNPRTSSHWPVLCGICAGFDRSWPTADAQHTLRTPPCTLATYPHPACLACSFADFAPPFAGSQLWTPPTFSAALATVCAAIVQLMIPGLLALCSFIFVSLTVGCAPSAAALGAAASWARSAQRNGRQFWPLFRLQGRS